MNRSGLNYTVNGREEWTPVKKARRKSELSSLSHLLMMPLHQILTVVVVVQVWMSRAADWWSIVYKKVFLVSPSIAKIHTGHAPIVPSPISSRIRSKNKDHVIVTVVIS